MADATADVGAAASLIDGDGEMPLGEAIDEGTMKSSRFIRSPLLDSADCRNCAMPLGGFGLALAAAAAVADALLARANLRVVCQ